MKTKQAIQTNLLGTRVVIGEETETMHGPTTEAANKDSIIRNVFTDKDGDLKYSIQIKGSGKLIDLYPHHFQIFENPFIN